MKTTAYLRMSRRIARGVSIGTVTRVPASGWAVFWLFIASLFR